MVVSRCLLGHPVRYDGGDKRQPGLMGLLAEWQVIAVCPELEAGLGVPRPPMDLVGPPGTERVVVRATGVDHGPALAAAIARLTARWAAGGVDGAILKARSPSCGLGSAARYDRIDDPAPAARVDGLFAAAMRRPGPDGIPPAAIHERALADPAARQRFRWAVRLRAELRRARTPAELAALWAHWRAAPHAAPLRAAGIGEGRFPAGVMVSGDRVALVGHIDRALSLATIAPSDHPTNGSPIADDAVSSPASGHRP